MEIPHNKDAEEAVLACCINGGDTNIFETSQPLLSSKDFYFEDHLLVWESMCELSSESTTIDLITVTERVTSKNPNMRLTTMEISDKVHTSVGLMNYIDIILKKSQLRAMRREYMTALDKIKEDKDPQVIQDDITRELDGFKPREKEVTHIKNSLDVIKDEFEAMARGDFKHEYIMTHIPHLDEKIKLELGCVFTIAAPTSVGKSALSMNIAMRSCSKDKTPTLVFSLEMPQKQLTKRMIGAMSKSNTKQIEEAVASHKTIDKVNNAIDKLNVMPLHTIHTVKSINQIASDVRRYKKEKGIKLVVIDYLQLIPFDAGRMGKADGIAMISQKIKQIALENDVAIILLSQLNREGARSDRPDLYHLKDSGSIENDADIVLIMNCKNNDPESAKFTDDYGTYMHINYVIGKNREGERGVRGFFKFYSSYGIFY
jgi:replicative DNA helicase